MSGPTVASASTGRLTAMLPAAVPAPAIASAIAIANRLVARPAGHDPLVSALIDGALAGGSPPQAAVLHRKTRVSAPLAATINGAAFSSGDDGIFVPTFAATLAAAEFAHVSADAWLAAFAVGAEVSARLARAWTTETPRRFIPASAVGQIGATLAVCRLLGVSAAATAPAMGFAAIQVSGTARAGTPEHALAVGNAARVAVETTFIARFGASGPLNAVEAAGLMLATPRLADQLTGLGETWIVAAMGGESTSLDPRLATLLN